MAIQKRGSVDMAKEAELSVEEKAVVDAEVLSVTDSENADEALQLVGKERTQQFSEEFNRKLRWKLV